MTYINLNANVYLTNIFNAVVDTIRYWSEGTERQKVH